jgi:recombinational DNA repair ATPase RecF
LNSLEAELLDRLAVHPIASDDEGILVGALLGDVELHESIGGSPPARAAPTGHAGGVLSQAPPAAAYLKSVTVIGFRGVGPATTLPLEPGPGLTVVCGRNGSGKSSFAEGLEVLLTGKVRRFEGRTAVWQDTWRCLHATATEVSAELVIEGVKGSAVVTRSWNADAKHVTDGTVRVRVPGAPDVGLERLGWGEALTLYRPFLSHAELEVLLARPSDLYDQLNALLGLEQIGVILTRLADARKQADALVVTAKDQLSGLCGLLADTDDERATTALSLLKEKTVDLAALESFAAGGPVADATQLQLLGRLRALNVAAPSEVADICSRLTAAAASLEQVGSSAAGDADATANLLAAAVDHFRRHGPGDCPVCGRFAALDDTWLAVTSEQIRRLQSQAQELRVASAEAETAAYHARLLVGGPPAYLVEAVSVGVDPGPTTSAWAQWSGLPAPGTTPSGLRDLSDHLNSTHPALHAAVATVRSAAGAEFDSRLDRWAPIAAAMSAWTAAERAARDSKTTVARIKRVETWIKAANNDLRNARLRPFAQGTAALWSTLRQESNVDLVKMTLTGAATRRAVDFEVTVDGNPAAGLGVMSQGEVNALALSVFLPRATSTESPLRFVVIDDPVQAMDPSKVDGMARVFSDAASTHQVVVFTHDDRLPAAIRNLNLPARVIQVTRQADSVVGVRPAGDPAEQHLSDARKLAAGDDIPAAVTARVIPGLCRAALEDVCFEITRRRRLGRGDSHADVESALAATTKLIPRLALAIFDDASRGGEVYAWCNRQIGNWAGDTLRAVNEGSHGQELTDPGALVGNAGSLIGKLRSKLP